MKPFSELVLRAKKSPKHIVMAEGELPRVIEGAVHAVNEGFATVTLLGRKSKIAEMLASYEFDDGLIQLVDPTLSKLTPEFVQELTTLRKHKRMTDGKAYMELAKPQNFGNMMVRLSYADGSVAGAQLTTADVVRSAIQIIGVDKRYSMVSSFFIMMQCQSFHDLKGALMFADCGIQVDPNESELVQISIAAADSAKSLLNLEPRIAMLSFSTKGSANHPNVEKINRVVGRIKLQRPDLLIDGELQLDASLIPSVSEVKAPGSIVAGQANVLIFPNLEAGNIGYKIAERIGKSEAIGPVLQGLIKPANDLSRGCDADAVYRMIAVTVAQAQSQQNSQ